ncbi:MAG: YraN family protein [Chitinophagales bacterium]|nr:YraN family protein [Chitinophagales bacterium]
MAGHLKLGERGEKLAVEFLKKQDYAILETRYRYSRYEIDIICRSVKGHLVFVEVKTRTNLSHGKPMDFVSKRKENYISQAAQYYIEKTGWDDAIRFDIISIEISGEHHKLDHIKDAFFPTSW